MFWYFSFELSVDMLDYMNDILALQAQGQKENIINILKWWKLI